jgi:uncharacterized RDD family membrane protein YckC
LFAISLLGSVVLEAICEGFHGSTPGTLLLSMVVVQEDGSPCRPGSAWIRSIAYFIDSLFFGLIGYFNMPKNPQQQRHGDEWAHTIVCRRSDVAQPERHWPVHASPVLCTPGRCRARHSWAAHQSDQLTSYFSG